MILLESHAKWAKIVHFRLVVHFWGCASFLWQSLKYLFMWILSDLELCSCYLVANFTYKCLNFIMNRSITSTQTALLGKTTMTYFTSIRLLSFMNCRNMHEEIVFWFEQVFANFTFKWYFSFMAYFFHLFKHYFVSKLSKRLKLFGNLSF